MGSGQGREGDVPQGCEAVKYSSPEAGLGCTAILALIQSSHFHEALVVPVGSTFGLGSTPPPHPLAVTRPRCA